MGNQPTGIQRWEPWSVTARNLPEHARNPIHTDAGARAAGFPAALVAGVTTYAYLTHVPLVALGAAWLASGGAEVRFRSPVFDGDAVSFVPEIGSANADATHPGVVRVTAQVDDDVRAALEVRRAADPEVAVRPGEVLEPVELTLEGEYGSDYAARAGDSLEVARHAGAVHPAVWPALANHVVHTQVARGSWVHTRSRIDHHRSVAVGARARVTAVVVERFDRPSGERAVLDVRVVVDDRVVVSIEHEAIVALA